jgi:hypothetical protein
VSLCGQQGRSAAEARSIRQTQSHMPPAASILSTLTAAAQHTPTERPDAATAPAPLSCCKHTPSTPAAAQHTLSESGTTPPFSCK